MEEFYETQLALGQYLLFHYGPPSLQLPYPFGPRDSLDFPARCVREVVAELPLSENARGCDVGCAVGRSAFELGRFCREVVALDRSRVFIEAACRLQEEGKLEAPILVEGDQTEKVEFCVPPELDRQRVRFVCGDALELLPRLGQFDLVVAWNLLDRVQDPGLLLVQLERAVEPGGWLALSSPYTWLCTYTPKEKWLVPGFGELQKRLGVSLELVQRKDLPFLLREHVRKYQWCVAEVTVWHKPKGAPR
ncbi:putative 4-mercaptohistidine N1-methyltransferase [Candidatus Methylacidithermus pantelleriae]|uniref:4-mercaptohistidine N1-methyltransferase n=1 Tax=Candidatus Methylacidithermus pantelleriae TaxID=2744239 RepID=A0A8J2BLD1_9BACT|nr:putative 4-mercaptohistidine N1-methyltransferase [Candidatus Methylacidithermus pantelleriae]CAF0692906.1 Putative 4-mercaptohistidine N1-methyltransferase [Candidatus Methylacidithermus pantelleriae]